MKSTTCPNDSCNTKFILKLSEILVPVWTNIINKSIEEGTVLKYWKETIIHPVQKQKTTALALISLTIDQLVT